MRRSSNAVAAFRAAGIHKAATAAEEQVAELSRALAAREDEHAGLSREAKKQQQAVLELEDMLRWVLCEQAVL
jgi:hypothetical protein